MVSKSFVILCAAGLAGSLFLGYCVYYDKKRRCDPDYKKKVLASKLQRLVKSPTSLLSAFGVFIRKKSSQEEVEYN